MIDSKYEQVGVNKILIIDDNSTDVRYLNYLLQQPQPSFDISPYEIKSVSSAMTGLKLWQNWLPDCILLDYNLPDMTGLQFMEAVNIESLSDPLAVIMLTGSGDESTAVQAMKLGISDYLVKGEFTGVELTETIHQAYEKAELLFELQQRREELALFADRLAHDMVTPLHSLGLHVELLDELLADTECDPLILQNLRTIDLITEQLSSFVQHLHDYTAVGRTNPSFEAVSLAEVVEQTLMLLQPEFEERKPQIVLCDLPVVRGCHVDLVQLIQNIISNSLKYNEKNVPRIEFSAGNINADFWQITISDDGIGIPLHEQRRIFQPFIRTSSTRQYKGSGLGLSTCRKIVESHGGKIWVESVLGEGTSVHFLLPSHSQSSSYSL